MRVAIATLLGLIASANIALAASGIDYRSVTENAILYDAPSTKGVKHFIVARGTPVEVVLTQGDWAKVRDSAGDMAWLEARQLSATRTVIVRADKAEARSKADDKSPIAFVAEKNVLLDLVDAAPAGWAKVRHRDGDVGFVKASQVWGL